MEENQSEIRPGESLLQYIERTEKETAENKQIEDNTLKAKYHRLKIAKERIIRDYLGGKSWDYMEKHYKLSDSMIRTALIDWGVWKKRGFIRIETKIIEDNKQDIIRLYKEGWPAKQIADKYGLKEPTIQLRLKSWGVKMRQSLSYNRERAIKLLEKGMDPVKVGEMVGTRDTSMYKLRAKILGSVSNKRAFFGPFTTKIIQKMYRRGFSVEDIFRALKKKKLLQMVNSSQPLRAYLEEQIKNGHWLYKRAKYTLSYWEAQEFINLLQSGMSLEDASFKLMIPIQKLDEYTGAFAIIKYPLWKNIPNKAIAVKRIRDLRKRGFTVNMISFFTGIGESPIHHALYEKTKIRLKAYRHDFEKLAPIVRAMRLRKKTVQQIAVSLRVSPAVINRIITEYKIPYVKRVFDNITVEKIRQMYKANIHPVDIARRLGLKLKSLQLELQRQGIMKFDKPWNINNTRYSKEEYELQNFYIQKYYLEPYYKSIHAIAVALALDKTTIKNRLKQLGIRIRSKAEADKLRRVHRFYKIKFHPQEEFIIHRRKFKLMSEPVKKMLDEYKR